MTSWDIIAENAAGASVKRVFGGLFFFWLQPDQKGRKNISQITKQALSMSLKHIIEQKPMSKITIADITEDYGITG